MVKGMESSKVFEDAQPWIFICVVHAIADVYLMFIYDFILCLLFYLELFIPWIITICLEIAENETGMEQKL